MKKSSSPKRKAKAAARRPKSSPSKGRPRTSKQITFGQGASKEQIIEQRAKRADVPYEWEAKVYKYGNGGNIRAHYRKQLPGGIKRIAGVESLTSDSHKLLVVSTSDGMYYTYTTETEIKRVRKRLEA